MVIAVTTVKHFSVFFKYKVMKKINQITKYTALFFALCIVVFSCQKIKRPELGEYPKDANTPGGPLKFYAAFDGTTSDPLFNAVDSIRANFAASNPLTVINGVSGKAVKGVDGKGIKYNAPNDFGENTSSFSISFWLKSPVPAGSRYETIFSLAHKGLYYRSAIHLDLYSGGYGSTAASASGYIYLEQPNGNYFDHEFSGSGGIPNLFDDQWHNIVLTYNEATSELKIYKDALVVKTLVWTGHGPFVIDNSKVIGLALAASNRQVGFEAENDSWMTTWSGGLDQFRMYGKKVLTQAEISALFSNKQ
jgi:Concanavalin A-like lectin/glucanases superfamily